MSDKPEIGVKDFIEQGFDGIRREVTAISKSLDAHRVESQTAIKETNARIDLLATRKELQDAIEAGSKKYRRLQAMFWTACSACSASIAFLANKMWDLTSHKINTP